MATGTRPRWWRALREALTAWASGQGQVLFCESAIGGALILLAVVPLAPRAAVLSAIAGAIATAVARARDFPRSEWRRGLYSYGGALVGLFWGLLFAPTLAAHVTLAIAAALAAPLTAFAHRVLTPRGVPTLALPALVLVTIAAPFLAPAEAAAPLTPRLEIAGWVLTVVGLAIGSGFLAGAALVGVAASTVTSFVVTGAVHGGIVSNGVATAIALGAVFLPWSLGALVVAAVAAVAAGLVWWWAAPWTGAIGVPLLVWPFVAVSIVTLRALHYAAVRRLVPGRPAPLPLASVGRPERGRAGHLARRELTELVRRSPRICVLTGAGVSTAAGLPDFRGPAGLWARTGRVTIEDFLASPEVRSRYWKEEQRFFELIGRAAPTAAHRALAALAGAGRLGPVVTQNVDGLHQAAGLEPDEVIEIHGNMATAHCVDCGRSGPRAMLSARIARGADALYCEACQGLLKGGSVMFGETVPAERLDAVLRVLLGSDLLLVLGTSLAVAPAAHMLQWAREAGIPVAIVNASPTPYDRDAAVAVTGDVDAIITDLVEELGRGRARIEPAVMAPR
jgi:NAD-dependent deacetylase